MDYSDLTDAELDAEIAAFRQARRDALTPGGVGTVKRVTDEGRSIEYTGVQLGALDRELRELIAERNRRAGKGGNAILVEFG